jgi:uncharacterized protein (DUF4415 family)
MAKASRGANVQPKPRQAVADKSRTRSAAKASGHVRPVAEAARPGWATDLVFDVREPKLAVSLRLDADVLRFFRGFGSGYQTRINEVLKAFMQARGGAASAPQTVVAARGGKASSGNGKRAAR